MLPSIMVKFGSKKAVSPVLILYTDGSLSTKKHFLEFLDLDLDQVLDIWPAPGHF